MIIGCDFHTRYQQIAMMDEATGELTERAGGSGFEGLTDLLAATRSSQLCQTPQSHSRRGKELDHDTWCIIQPSMNHSTRYSRHSAC